MKKSINDPRTPAIESERIGHSDLVMVDELVIQLIRKQLIQVGGRLRSDS